MEELSQLFSIGADYRSASASQRGMLGVSGESLAARLSQLLAGRYAREAAILSTCNRTEVYCLTDRPAEVAKWLSGNGGGDALFRLRAEAAVRRAFCVASGLESQIIGEPEITGQFKRAAQIARDNGASGVFINRLLEKSLAAAKAVRGATDIGRHSVSYCGLLARAAAGIFPDFSAVSVLFVGAGGMARSGAPIFAKRGARKIAVAARSAEKAEAVAKPAGGEGIALAALPAVLENFDIVICATSSPLPLIGKGAVEHAIARRRHRPMVFADLGVPRDIEPEIAALPDVFLYTLEQLGAQAEQSQQARGEAADQAREIVDKHVADFCRWWKTRPTPETLARREQAETARQLESQRAAARLRRGENPEEVLNDFSRRLAAKLLHPKSDD
ncbi:MAG: glutamyl-tRNA reductase [Gammaproteobacteria bacterium]